MAHRVCPWWLGYFLISPIRRWRQNPEKILQGHVREGMTVLEPGPGMGFFTLELLRRVGTGGRVVAVDVQSKMLSRLKQRADQAGLGAHLDARLTSAETMGLADLAEKVDFTLAFAVVHEFPDAGDFFGQVATASKPGAAILLAEPKGHVSPTDFASELNAAGQKGLAVKLRPAIPGSLTALLRKE